MSIDSNRRQVFYCSTAGLTPPPAPRQQSFVQETQSAVDSTTPSSSPSPPSYPPPPPLLLIRPLTTQPSSTTATTTTTRSPLPPQSLNSIPPLVGGRGKTINITITRKKLKVTSGAGDFPISILKPLANVIRSAGGKIKNLDAISIRPPIVSIRPPPQRSSQQRIPPPRPSPPQSQTISQQQHSPPSPQPQPPSLIVSNPILPTTTPTLAPNAPSAVQVSPSTLPSKILMVPEIIESCPYCDTYFYTYKTLAYHMMTVHFSTMVSNVSTCAACSIVYADYGTYTNHCLQMHCIYPTGTLLEDPITIASPVNPLYRQCNICNLTFPSTKAIVAHFFGHLGPTVAYTCRLCRQQIPSLFTLVAHLKISHSIQFQLHPHPQQASTQCPPKGPSNCLSSISPILPVYSN